MKIAGCVPAYNNEATIAQAVESLKAQTIPLDDIFVVDDGSTDATAQRAKEAGARVVSMETNQGRGAARARAIDETDADLLLSVDGTASLATDFLEKCLPWFEDPQIAAVNGRLHQPQPKTAADRWRGRHLLFLGQQVTPSHMQSFATWACLMRCSIVERIGNFDRACRQSEDAELSRRLNANGFSMAFETRAIAMSLVSNSTQQVLERYWRWYSGEQPLTTRLYLKWIALSAKSLALQDLKDRDPTSALISLALPHYAYLHQLLYRRNRLPKQELTP